MFFLKGKKSVFIIFSFITILFTSCSGLRLKRSNDVTINIETKYGVIKMKLYNNTPLHKENIITLVDKKYYDSLLIHRVIPDFMIQMGDPNSKKSNSNSELGFGGPGYIISAEISTKLIHKRGAIAAARLGGDQNPRKSSSGSQFYIVQGKICSDEELDAIENQRIERMTFQLIQSYIEKPGNKNVRDVLITLQNENKSLEFNQKILEIKKILKNEILAFDEFRYTQEQRNVYKTIGGSPHLDFEYTVFGEVIAGMDVVDTISRVETNASNRPKVDIILKISIEK